MLATATPARAQADFKPGYVVLPAGDTLRGEVDFRDARFNSAQCRFRPSADADIVTYKPAELRGYGLVAEHKTCRALVPPEKAAPLAVATLPVPYFMEALFDGPATLYLLPNLLRGDRFFVTTATFPLTELRYRQVPVEKEGRTFIEEQFTFRTTLAQVLPGCPAAQALLPKILFFEKPLVRVVTT